MQEKPRDFVKKFIHCLKSSPLDPGKRACFGLGSRNFLVQFGAAIFVDSYSDDFTARENKDPGVAAIISMGENCSNLFSVSLHPGLDCFIAFPSIESEIESNCPWAAVIITLQLLLCSSFFC